MTKGTRRWLFYGLIALFLVAGTAVVLYAQGWRLDIKTGRATKIGAIYVRSYPEQAAIFLNGKSVENKSGFFSPGTLISDLFPKTYAIRLAATGYESWQEDVTVLPSLVTQLKYAVLVPQDETVAASGTAERFFAMQGIMTRESLLGTISTNGKMVGQGTLTDATADGRAFVFKSAGGGYRIRSVENGTTTDLSASLSADGIAASAIQNVMLDPHDGSQIVVVGQKRIWTLDLGTLALTLIEKTPSAETLSPSVAVGDSLIAWTRFESASDTSEIVFYDRSAGSLRETSSTLAGATQKIALIRNGQFGILQNDGSLYLYDGNTDIVRKLADDVMDFSTSADGAMIAAQEHASAEFFDQDDPTDYYRFNLPDIAQVRQLIWYQDDDHLFVAYPDHVSFLDLQDAKLNNFTTVAFGTSPSYDLGSNSLYFINADSQLMRLKFPN